MTDADRPATRVGGIPPAFGAGESVEGLSSDCLALPCTSFGESIIYFFSSTIARRLSSSAAGDAACCCANGRLRVGVQHLTRLSTLPVKCVRCTVQLNGWSIVWCTQSAFVLFPRKRFRGNFGVLAVFFWWHSTMQSSSISMILKNRFLKGSQTVGGSLCTARTVEWGALGQIWQCHDAEPTKK